MKMVKRKNWVWDYAKREGDCTFCNLCDSDGNNEYSCIGGTISSLIRHLKSVYGIKTPQESIEKR
jgi:hypothetical protein